MRTDVAPDSRPLSMTSPKAVRAEACACAFLSRKEAATCATHGARGQQCTAWKVHGVGVHRV